MNDKFEYKVIPVRYLDRWDGNPSENELNLYGNVGWELTVVINENVVFKRKIKGEDE